VVGVEVEARITRIGGPSLWHLGRGLNYVVSVEAKLTPLAEVKLPPAVGKLAPLLGGAMHSLETSVEISVMARQGKSIKGIARELGVSRNTVRKYLKRTGEPVYRPRLPRAVMSAPSRRS
jgi:hypothetical protein